MGRAKLLFVIIVLLASDISYGEGDTTKVYNYNFLEIVNFSNNHFSTGNPAALVNLDLDNFAILKSGYNKINRDSKYSYEPGDELVYSISTTGVKKIRDVTFKGSFSYVLGKYSDLIYNSTLRFEPNFPYYLGDTINDIQRSEGFVLEGGFAYNISEKLSGGLNVKYSNVMGAKQKDPRNLNKISNINVIPGVSYSSGKFYSGISVDLSRFAEEVSISVLNPAKSNLFQFLGMGYFRFEPNIYSYSNMYIRHGLISSVYTGFKSSKTDNLTEVKVQLSSEEVRAGSAYRIIEGVVDQFGVDFANRLSVQKNDIKHQFSLEASLKNLSGAEVDQNFVKVTHGEFVYDSLVTVSWVEGKQVFNSYRGALKYRLLKVKDNGLPALMAEARISGYYDDISHNPVQTYGNYNYTGLVASAMVEPSFGTVNIISPSLGIEVNKNINSQYTYREIVKSFPSIAENDFMISSSGYCRLQGGITYEKFFIKKAVRSFFFTLDFGYQFFDRDEFSGLVNTSWDINTGITF